MILLSGSQQNKVLRTTVNGVKWFLKIFFFKVLIEDAKFFKIFKQFPDKLLFAVCVIFDLFFRLKNTSKFCVSVKMPRSSALDAATIFGSSLNTTSALYGQSILAYVCFFSFSEYSTLYE